MTRRAPANLIGAKAKSSFPFPSPLTSPHRFA